LSKIICVFSQGKNDFITKEINGIELQEDLTQIRRVILQSHPNPFVYVGKSTWDSTFLSLLNYFEEPRTLYDFTYKTSAWLNQLKDSHIGISLMDLLYEKHGEKSWLHFNLRKIDNKFYATYFPMNNVPFGSEIIEINSVSVDTLYKQSYVFALQEGDSFSAKEQYATEQIHVLYNLLYPSPKEPEKIPVKHINDKGDTLFTFVETINFDRSRKEINKFLNLASKEVEHKIDTTNELAILKINSFYPVNQKEFSKEVDYFFDTIKDLEISKLLIDIRSNSGGYFSCVNYLFNYIDTSRIPRTKNFIAKRSKYDRFSSSNNPWVKLILRIQKSLNLTEDAKNNHRFYNLPYGYLDTLTELHTTRDKFLDKKYLGKCYLAINGTSISASVDCASWFRQINRGIILGEPCMGPLTGTCGNPVSFGLKNTGVEVLTSTMRSYTKPRFSIQKESIIPDVILKNTISNFRQKIDVVYEYILKDEK
jgi:hypothetical protein